MTPENSNSSDLQKTKILLVEDELSLLTSLASSLQLLNDDYEVIGASSAEEGLDYIKTNHISLLITDLMLPKLSGLDLISELYQLQPSVKSVLVTAYGNSEIQARAKKNGCVSLIPKPFNFTQLVSVINKALSAETKFKASLPEVKLWELLSFYQLLKKSGVLSIVSTDSSSGTIIFDKGKIVSARFGTGHGPKAFLKLLNLNGGSINALSSDHFTESSVPKKVMPLLEVIKGSSCPQIYSQLSELISPEFLSQFKEQEIKNIYTLLSDSGYFWASKQAKMKSFSLDDSNKSNPVIEKNHNLKPSHASKSKSNGVFQVSEIKSAVLKSVQESEIEEELTLAPEVEEKKVEKISFQARDNQYKIKMLISRGINHFKKQELKKARIAWEQVLELDPKNKSAKKNLTVLTETEKAVK